MSTDIVWRVALVESSSSPGEQIPWLAVGEADIVRVSRHSSFICWLSPRSDAPPVAWRVRYRRGAGMSGHYTWDYREHLPKGGFPFHEVEPLYGAPQMHPED